MERIGKYVHLLYVYALGHNRLVHNTFLKDNSKMEHNREEISNKEHYRDGTHAARRDKLRKGKHLEGNITEKEPARKNTKEKEPAR